MIVLALLACSDQGLSLLYTDPYGGKADIHVEPQLLDFWTLQGGESRELDFTVRNVGDARLFVESLELEGSDAFELLDYDGFELGPEESMQVTASFSPMSPEPDSARVWVRSDDADEPELPVDLLGEGRLPWLVISPDTHDFGEYLLGCGDSVDLVLQNVGQDVLEIDEVLPTGDVAVSYELDFSTPLSLAPGEYVRGKAHYLAGIEGLVTGELSVRSNDPRELVTATQEGTGLGGQTQVEEFTVPNNPPVDVIFAVDQSCSMEDDAESLGANFSAFVADITEVTFAWRVGVVTYDTGCFNSGILTGSTPNLETTFAAAVSAGEDGEINDDEALLKLSARALSQTGNGGCNAGFLRSGATLHIIVITDEPERSVEQVSAWTWDHWLGEIKADAKGPVVISGVVDNKGCNEGMNGYRQAIAATGGATLSICSGDWAAHVEGLAEYTLSTASSFELAELPVSSSLQVEVDGTPMSEGWSYDADLNSVIFATPLAGLQQVRVSYQLYQECPE